MKKDKWEKAIEQTKKFANQEKKLQSIQIKWGQHIQNREKKLNQKKKIKKKLDIHTKVEKKISKDWTKKMKETLIN